MGGFSRRTRDKQRCSATSKRPVAAALPYCTVSPSIEHQTGSEVRSVRCTLGQQLLLYRQPNGGDGDARDFASPYGLMRKSTSLVLTTSFVYISIYIRSIYMIYIYIYFSSFTLSFFHFQIVPPCRRLYSLLLCRHGRSSSSWLSPSPSSSSLRRLGHFFGTRRHCFELRGGISCRAPSPPPPTFQAATFKLHELPDYLPIFCYSPSLGFHSRSTR